MRVTTEMIHPDLQKSAKKFRVFNFFLSRKWGFRLFLRLSKLAHGKQLKGVQNEERYIKSKSGGPDIRIRIYKPENTSTPLPALLYCHGGGYAVGSPEESHPAIKKFCKKRPCIVVAPDYRKSQEAPYPAAFNDCYDTLLWMKENAASIGAKENNFIVAGHSAGGGLTAAVTLKARDTQDVKIAFQMPIYPMIDDRQNTESAKLLPPIWDAKANAIAWNFYLKDLINKNAEIPSYAAPARNKDYRDFPPTITFVGDMEPFRDETLTYVAALKEQSIPVQFKLYKGCYHAFDTFGGNSEIQRDALNFTFDSFAAYYDAYCID